MTKFGDLAYRVNPDGLALNWYIKETTKFDNLAYRVNSDGSALSRYVDICNLFFKSNYLT